jgi:hypothetical protein
VGVARLLPDMPRMGAPALSLLERPRRTRLRMTTAEDTVWS